MDIRSINGKVLFSSLKNNIKESVAEAVKLGANLSGAYLSHVNLYGANLYGARYDVAQVLKADWGKVSPELCAYLMRLDASALPNGNKLMENWANGGDCPLFKTNGVGRVAIFQENRDDWKLAKTLPPITLWELWTKLAAEKNIKL